MLEARWNSGPLSVAEPRARGQRACLLQNCWPAGIHALSITLACSTKLGPSQVQAELALLKREQVDDKDNTAAAGSMHPTLVPDA